MRLLVVNHLFSKHISKNRVFRRQEKLVEYITRNLNLQITLPETYILQQGETPDKFYFISSGTCWVFVKDVVEEEAFVRKIGVGDFFGEIALMNGGQRTATI